MKNVLIVLLTIAGLYSCGDPFQQSRCWEAVQQTYPDSDTYPIPERKFTFLVVDSCGTIWYVETMGSTTTEITSRVKLKGCLN